MPITLRNGTAAVGHRWGRGWTLMLTLCYLRRHIVCRRRFLYGRRNRGNYIAQWDGSNWSALDVGLTGHYLPGVSALAVSGSTLYAGGYFTNAGGVPAITSRSGNGSSWSALTSGVNDEVTALAASSSTLYAGGVFTAAGGIPANYIAQWDGTNWSAAGSGIEQHCLCTDGLGQHVVRRRGFHDGGHQCVFLRG